MAAKAQPAPAQAPQLAPEASSDRRAAVLTHVLGLLTLFLGPLIVYLAVRKRATPWLRAHINEALNYHVLIVVVVIVLVVLAVILTAFGQPGLAFIAGLLAVLVFAINIILSIVAAVWAGRGKSYHFPLDIKLFR
jgi:uncharacterized protein